MDQVNIPSEQQVPLPKAVATIGVKPVEENQTILQLIVESLAIIRANRKLYIKVALLVFVGAVAAAYAKSQKYESSTKVMVQLDMQTVALSPADVRYNLAAKMADEVVGNQAEMLRSRELIDRVIDQLGEGVLDGPPKSGFVGAILNTVKGIQKLGGETLIFLGLAERTSARSNLVQTISKGLKVLPARKSQMIDISLRLKNREAAQNILATLIASHQKKLAEMDAISQAYEVYNSQANQLKSELEKAERAVSAFKVKHGFINLASEKATMLKNADRLKSLLDGIEGGNTPEPEAVEDGDAINPIQDGVGGNDLARLVVRVNELRLERTRRSAVYADGSVKLDEIQTQLAAAEQLLNNKLKWVQSAAQKYHARSKVLDALQPEFDHLTRDVAMLEDSYRAYIKATEDRRLSAAKDRRVLLMVIDQADLPESPVAPTRLMIVLGGLFGSLMLAAAWVLITNWWMNRATRFR